METIKEYVERTKIKINEYTDLLAVKPKLVIINVGDDPASKVYIKGKLKDCADCGIDAELIHYDSNIDEAVLYDKIEALNSDNTVTGFIVQLPLPEKFDENKIIEMINPKKDVDGFSRLTKVNPATPQGIIEFLESQSYDFTDKNAVVLGRSNIVGRPVSKLLLDRNCNVTTLHSKTSESNKRHYLENADLIITAVGKCNVIDHTYNLKSDAIIIDVGINYDAEGKLIGDCERNLPVAFQSPVPGGCGLTTRLALITNLLRLYKLV